MIGPLIYFLFNFVNSPRPMRYDHGNFHPIRHHHHHHHHQQHQQHQQQQQQQQYPHSMHPMNDYGMRYQQPHTNLANMVSQNIQQRFGTGYAKKFLTQN
jgi:hypothetical protein